MCNPLPDSRLEGIYRACGISLEAESNGAKIMKHAQRQRRNDIGRIDNRGNKTSGCEAKWWRESRWRAICIYMDRSDRKSNWRSCRGRGVMVGIRDQLG